ncbi:MAG: multicopper oxidase domain-containing protein [Gemmatimonadota bacterium]
MRRRSWLKWLAGGGAGAAAASWFGVRAATRAHPDGEREPGTAADAPRSTRRAYGHGAEPPVGVTLAGRRDLVVPPPARAQTAAPATHEVNLWVAEQPVPIARDLVVPSLTYNGTIPGPILRCTEGDAVVVRCRNLGAVPHTVHFHGRHGAQADGWEPVPAGGEATYRFTAAPFGVHPYHCHVGHHDDHVLAGMHGVLIVDPREGRAPAHEFVLALSGHQPGADGRAAVYTWNGVAGLFAREPLKVPVGELVRVYLVNACLTDAAASFHLHAATFDVYRTGTRRAPDEHTDVVTLGPMERAILEFRLPTRGRYLFHPHQPWMARRGATGWFAAV